MNRTIPTIVPLYFDPGRDTDFDRMLAALRQTFAEEAQFLPPQPLGSSIPASVDAVVLPQLLGEGYRQAAKFKAIKIPIMLLTTEFGTLSMWDWELATYLRTEGVQTIAPYNIAQAKKVLAALGVRRELKTSKFLAFQDNPGDGAQAPIFKRFYWWEQECSQRMFDKFGVRVIHKSYKELGTRAKAISDSAAEEAWRHWDMPIAAERQPLLSAVKLYLALKAELDADPAVRGMGINCLNESHFSDTTPCLAWCMLYEERQLIWGCEGDTMSMLTEHLLHRSLGVPIMMTNVYPFLLGNAALKHERIASFPAVQSNPQDHILCGHCGYQGVIARPFATEWTLRKKVLAIVDENATALDARFPTGNITMAKLLPTMDTLSVAEGELEGYTQFPGSDCLNGAVIRIKSGTNLMRNLVSHHYLLTAGHNLVDIGFISKVLGLQVQEI